MELRPFRSIRFSPRVLRQRGLADVFAPPYDQISPVLQDRLYDRAPENIVRITHPKKDVEDPYRAAAATLSGFLSDGTLEKERMVDRCRASDRFESRPRWRCARYERTARVSTFESGVFRALSLANSVSQKTVNRLRSVRYASTVRGEKRRSSAT